MHNMCVEDRIQKVGRDQYRLEITSAFSDINADDPTRQQSKIFNNGISTNEMTNNIDTGYALSERIFRTDNSIRDATMHESLMSDLIKNLWDNHKHYILYNPIPASIDDL